MRAHYELILKDTEKRALRAVRVQTMDEKSPWYGAFPQNDGVYQAKSTIYCIESLISCYCCPDSSLYHSELLLERAKLGLDYVDIFYHHRPDPETPLYETMWALASIVKQGKALYVGLSNYNGETLERATAILDDLKCPFIINQNRYSIFDRTIENNGLKETSERLGKGIIAFSPLAQGLLTNRYLDGIPEDSRVKTDGRFLKESILTDTKLKQITRLNELAAQRGQTLAEMSLAWVLKDRVITSVLIGASKSSQILDNIKALENTNFTREELDLIDEISL